MTHAELPIKQQQSPPVLCLPSTCTMTKVQNPTTGLVENLTSAHLSFRVKALTALGGEDQQAFCRRLAKLRKLNACYVSRGVLTCEFPQCHVAGNKAGRKRWLIRLQLSIAANIKYLLES